MWIRIVAAVTLSIAVYMAIRAIVPALHHPASRFERKVAGLAGCAIGTGLMLAAEHVLTRRRRRPPHP